jgi:hypothetical protein
VGLSIDATRRSYPLAAPTLRSRVAGSSEKGISGEEKMSAPGASSKISTDRYWRKADVRQIRIWCDFVVRLGRTFSCDLPLAY